MEVVATFSNPLNPLMGWGEFHSSAKTMEAHGGNKNNKIKKHNVCIVKLRIHKTLLVLVVSWSKTFLVMEVCLFPL